MARLTKEEKRVFDPSLLIKNQKWKANTIKELMISGGGKGGSPGTPTPDWDKDWPPKPKPQPQLAMNFQDAGFGDGGFISTDKPHIYINRGAEAYILMPDGDFRFDGMYDPARHGNAFPGLGLVRAKNGMKIAKKKRNEQRAYEDFVKDSQNMPLDESFKDLRRGQDGEGFDILHELLDLDEAKNNPTDGMKIAEKRLPFINIDDLEDPVKTLKDGGYPDPDVLDFPSGGYYRKGSDVLDRLIDLELVNRMKINPKKRKA